MYPPPINLDVTDHEKPSQSEEKLSSYALRLIRRLLNMADADFTSVPFNDRDLLEEALNGTNLEKIARRQKCSGGTIRRRVINALDTIGLKMSSWENQQRQLDEMGEEVNKLQVEAIAKEKTIVKLTKSVEALEDENNYLRSVVKAYSEHHQKYDPHLIKVDRKTRKIIEGDLSSIQVPSAIANSFAVHRINTVLDLIRHTASQLARFDGISESSITIIKKMLNKQDLELGTDIRWIPSENEYYIYPKQILQL